MGLDERTWREEDKRWPSKTSRDTNHSQTQKAVSNGQRQLLKREVKIRKNRHTEEAKRPKPLKVFCTHVIKMLSFQC